jgi:hypothetical protein
MIIAEDDEKSLIDFGTIVHRVVRIFVDKFEQYSISAGMYFPDYSSNTVKKLDRLFFRIVFRSPVTTLRSDMNGLDIYTSSVLGMDRYMLAKKLFLELRKYKR